MIHNLIFIVSLYIFLCGDATGVKADIEGLEISGTGVHDAKFLKNQLKSM